MGAECVKYPTSRAVRIKSTSMTLDNNSQQNSLNLDQIHCSRAYYYGFNTHSETRLQERAVSEYLQITKHTGMDTGFYTNNYN